MPTPKQPLHHIIPPDNVFHNPATVPTLIIEQNLPTTLTTHPFFHFNPLLHGVPHVHTKSNRVKPPTSILELMKPWQDLNQIMIKHFPVEICAILFNFAQINRHSPHPPIQAEDATPAVLNAMIAGVRQVIRKSQHPESTSRSHSKKRHCPSDSSDTISDSDEDNDIFSPSKRTKDTDKKYRSRNIKEA